VDESGAGPGEQVRDVGVSFYDPPEVPLCVFTVETVNLLELVQDNAEPNLPLCSEGVQQIQGTPESLPLGVGIAAPEGCVQRWNCEPRRRVRPQADRDL
jgi:hypothetical protein